MENQELEEKVDRVFRMLQCVPGWYDTYYAPVHALTPDDSPVDILWDLFREGGTLCMALNADKRNTKIPICPMDLSKPNPFINANCKKNVFAFLGFYGKIRPGAPIFTLAELHGDDEAPFERALGVIEELLLETDIDFQEAFTPTESVRKASTQAPSVVEEKTMKQRVIEEIIATERTYVTDLQKLQQYKKAVEQGEHALEKRSVDAIFHNLDVLLTTQENFLQELTIELSKPPAEQSIGSFFLEAVVDRESFREYSKFCSNYPSALEHVSEITEQLVFFDDLIKESQLHWYLIKPIQRICKYPLLLRELLKHTDEGDAEHDVVAEALAAVKKVTDNVNEEHRKGENSIIAKDLVKRLVGQHGFTLASFGKLLLVEPLMVSIQQSEQQAIVYLFEKYVLFCREVSKVDPTTKKKGTEIHLKTSIETKQLVTVSNFGKAKDGTETFRLKCLWQDGSEVLTLFLNFKNQEALMRWLKTFLVLLTELKEKKKVAGAGLGVPTVHVVPVANATPEARTTVVGKAKGPKVRPSIDKAQDILLGRKGASSGAASTRKRPKDLFDLMDSGSDELEEEEAEDEERHDTYAMESGLQFESDFLEDGGHYEGDAEKRPSLLDKASSFFQKRSTVSSAPMPVTRPSLDESGGSSKAEKILLGKSSGVSGTGNGGVKKPQPKDIFAWMDDEIENAEADVDVNDSFLRKHFVTSSMLEGADVNGDPSAGAGANGDSSTGTGGSTTGVKSSSVVETHKIKNEASVRDFVASDPSSVSPVKSASSRVKIRYHSHVWLVRFPPFSALKPYTISLREAAATKMKENPHHHTDLLAFSESFEPVPLIASRLQLVYIDTLKNHIKVSCEDDFWLCLSDAGISKTISFAVQ